ncbi:MAG: TIGR00730 family Rossman fold protein, partial [Waddliaceae bacterium]|nr:TIGR00730 family Rossman fold protein [Waddliaceae bacterium]
MVENKPLHKEFKNITPSDSWRVFRILSEFVDGFETLTDLGPSVTIFGSARMTDDNPYYSVATDVAEKIASRGFSVITGGGPGVMEAANKGAQLAKGSS